MAVRIRTQIIVVASLDSDENQKQFARDASSLTTVIEEFDLEQSGELELAGGEADYTLEKGKVITGQFLYIETTGDLTIKLDGEAVGHKIGIPGSGTKAKWAIRSEFLSAPKITNDDPTNAAQVSYLIAGSKS